jgi:mannose-6-phosphate isomerase-like protein (cupin superfamily)
VYKRNWRDREPILAHGTPALDWLMMVRRSDAARIPDDPDGAPMDRVRFFTRCTIEPGVSRDDHQHADQEQLYYIISGRGWMSVDGERQPVRDGDLVYVPRLAMHNIGNDGQETLELLLLGVQLDR